LAYQQISRTVQSKRRLLLLSLDRYITNPGAFKCFTNRLGIRAVGFRTLDEWFDILGRNQPNLMPRAFNYSGVIYVFRAKRADRVKLVWWDGTGLCLMAKRLESGGFRWAHVRRKFYELADTSPVATEVLRRIALLYGVEDEVRGSPAEQRCAARTERSRVIVDDLHQYLAARGRQVSAKSKLGEAIRYALTRWDGLSRFIDDGRIELDSNTVERSIRPLALNRKNALFAGSDEGGDNWAAIATLIENCKIGGINPHDWMTETLAKLANGHPAKNVAQLMPWTPVA